MMPAPWLSLLGLAQRAGKILSGEESVLSSIRNQKAKLVIVAGDASERSKETWQHKCEHYGVPLRIVSDRFEIGGAMGKAHRVAVAVTDIGFSKKLIALLDQ